VSIARWSPASAWSLYDSRTKVLHAERLSSKQKSSVFRLHFSAGRPAVIAERASVATVALESIIYREVLPQIDVTGPEWFGEVSEDDTGFGWLFIVDVGDVQYDNCQSSHGKMAADWLGRFHGVSSAMEPPPLPDRGHAYFLERLRRSRRIVEARLRTEPRSNSDTLRRAVEQCEFIESHWRHLVEFDEMVPSSVVHGDFSALNIRFVDRNGTSRLMPIDWEKSGWGMPFVDFVRGLDIDTYAAQVATYWPNVRRASVERMLNFSRLLRPLTHQWEKKSAAKIGAYYVSMQDALTSLGWR
jgi:hypothetical protein